MKCALKLLFQATFLFFIAGVLTYAYFWYTIFTSWLLSKRIVSAKKKLDDFKSKMVRRDPAENLNAEIWYPDMRKYICVNNPEFSAEKGKLACESFHHF